jgi:hypothetical protein
MPEEEAQRIRQEILDLYAEYRAAKPAERLAIIQKITALFVEYAKVISQSN